jgi:hypothetical protein
VSARGPDARVGVKSYVVRGDDAPDQLLARLDRRGSTGYFIGLQNLSAPY